MERFEPGFTSGQTEVRFQAFGRAGAGMRSTILKAFHEQPLVGIGESPNGFVVDAPNFLVRLIGERQTQIEMGSHLTEGVDRLLTNCLVG